MPRSAIARIRSGEWREGAVTPLVVLAAVSVAVDVVTTNVVLRNPDFRENNPVLVAMAELHPMVATAYQTVAAGALVVAGALALGWLSRVALVYVVATNGTLGLNNLVLFLTDTALYEMLGVSVALATSVLTPLAGAFLGLAWEYDDHGIPWGEVALAVALVVPTTAAVHFLL